MYLVNLIILKCKELFTNLSIFVHVHGVINVKWTKKEII
jgi:hypothetical protein